VKESEHRTRDRGSAGLLLVSPNFGELPLDFLAAGEPHDCPYLPGRSAREDYFWIEEFPPELYHDFMDHGFRRAGLCIYRPLCDDCRECRPIRVAVERFRPSKSQRRVLRKNEDLDIRVIKPRFTREKFRMYTDYLAAQHGAVRDEFDEEPPTSLYRSCVRTREFEYRRGGRLVACGIVDLCSRSLSSVYAYYDPDCSARSLGTFSAIQEILYCRDSRIPYYYLGFLVEGCSSMSYKSRFKPHEILESPLNWIEQERNTCGE
jgi:leucyl-tRNA---protein transferase